MENESNRRQFLKGVGAAGAVFFADPVAKTLAAVCSFTPPQTAGPFYPGEAQFHEDNDLTIIKGHTAAALGQVIYIKGTVLNHQCEPVENAAVEIWQACASGKYNNKNDPNPAALDPNFKYWGETFTDELGTYMFKTIVPGAYPADTDWMRPPHIHFKVTRLGYKELVTQMYFKDNPYNDGDLILKAVPAADRPGVIVAFKPAGPSLEPGSLIGTFDITIASVK
jgi:protocatechuate 3,4-dioxygenase beta subunit